MRVLNRRRIRLVISVRAPTGGKFIRGTLATWDRCYWILITWTTRKASIWTPLNQSIRIQISIIRRRQNSRRQKRVMNIVFPTMSRSIWKCMSRLSRKFTLRGTSYARNRCIHLSLVLFTKMRNLGLYPNCPKSLGDSLSKKIKFTLPDNTKSYLE
jgi:hypothetical protein